MINRLALVLACAALALAHGGFEHVGGTLLTIEKSVLTVKTTRGNVTIRMDAKTEITRDGKPALASDLKPGMKVVIDVPEEAKEKIAHLVKIGAATKAAPDAQEAHDHDGHK